MSDEQELVGQLKRGTTEAAAFAQKAERVGKIVRGYQGFIGDLRRELKLIEEAAAQLDLLDFTDYRGDLKSHYAQRLAAERAEVEDVVQAATAIVEQVNSEARIRRLSDDRFQSISESVGKLLIREQKRRLNTLRVQGPKVRMIEEKLEKVSLFEGSLAEAYVTLAKQIASALLDPHSKLNALEAWLADDHSIWLYHHSKTEKWKCLFFRIEINRTANDLSLSLESYVPYGIAGDPANYEVADSDVYTRPGWTLAEAMNKTLNQMRSFNLNVSQSETFGKTVGESVSHSVGEARSIGTQQNASITEGQSVGQTRTETTTEGTSSTESTSDSFSESWFDGWSESKGSSTGWSSGQGGGGMSGGSNYNASTSGGHSTGHTKTQGTTTGVNSAFSVGDGTTRTENQGKTIGQGTSTTDTTNKTETNTEQTSRNYGVTLGTTKGVSVGDGEAIQLSFKAFGIALDKPAEQHLAKWREANDDAARVFDRVVSSFQSWATGIKEHLSQLAKRRTRIVGTSLDERLPELARLIPLEIKDRHRLQQTAVGGAPEKISSTVREQASIVGGFSIPPQLEPRAPSENAVPEPPAGQAPEASSGGFPLIPDEL